MKRPTAASTGIVLTTFLSLSSAQAFAESGLVFQNEQQQSEDNAHNNHVQSRRIHPIQRIYKDNARIRRTMEELENEMPYYQTGVRGDETFMVNYENHPFDRMKRSEGRGDGELFIICWCWCCYVFWGESCVWKETLLRFKKEVESADRGGV
jgi:hypothetical protein